MAKQSQAQYLRDILQLTDTLVIKYHEAALAVNKAYLDYHQVDYSESPLSDWPYYRNMAGQYVTGIDTPMTVRSLDTFEDIDFTYENLQIHTATRDAYTIGSTQYRELLQRYPAQDWLIRGIINPTDINLAINAPNFSILNFDESLVQSNETNLMPELQARIDAFILRYHRPRWAITQNLYPAGFWAELVFSINTDIQNIRLWNCGTRYVHTYHLWAYLGSFVRLDRWQDFLTANQAHWLYRNIAVLINNAGKSGTFDALLENILTARTIPLTRHEIWHDVSGIPDEIYATAEVAKIPLNEYATQVEGIVKTTLAEVLGDEQPLARDNDLYYRGLLYSLPLSARSSYVNQIPTKVLESKMIDRTENVPIKYSATVFNQWVYLAMQGRYIAEVTITNPVNGDVLTLSQKEAVQLWAWCVSKEFEAELTVLPPVMVHNVMRPMLPSYDDIRASVPDEYISREDILVALDWYVAPGRIISREGFQQYCHNAFDATTFYRQLVAFCEDPRRRGYMQNVCNKFYLRTHQSLGDGTETYAQWFQSRNLDFSSLTDARIAEFGEDLYANATGTDLKDVTSLKEIQAAMIGIMTTLSSYSVHYLKEINSGPFDTPNNIAARFGLRGENDEEFHRWEIGTRMLNHGESERLTADMLVAPVLNNMQIGIHEYDFCTGPRPVNFSVVGAGREHVRIRIPRAVFSAVAGPSISDLTDRSVFDGAMLVQFTDPVLSGNVDMTGKDDVTFE